MECTKGVVIGLALFTASLTIVYADLSVSVDISQTHALPSENITVLCRLNGNDKELTVYWYKEVRDQEGETLKELIATGDVLTPLFKTLGRFSAKVTPIGMATLYILSLSLVTSEDSGHYGCYVGGNTDVYDSESLEVYKKPDEIVFSNTTGGVLLFSENQPAPVECRVLGVLPSPTVHIFVGDTDYTNYFTKETRVEVLCPGSYGTKENCPLHFMYNVYLRNPHFQPTEPGLDDKIRCEVDLPESGDNSFSTEVELVYQFSPKFECDRVQYTVRGTEDYVLSCHMTSNPSFDWWSWKFDVDGVMYELRSDHDPGYTHTTGVKVTEEKLKSNSVTLSLHISQVTKEYYTVYQLQVSNSQGNRTAFLQLREILAERTTTPAISKAVMSSVPVYLIFALLSLKLLVII